MGLLDRFRKQQPFIGCTADQLGDDFHLLCEGLQDSVLALEPIIEPMGPMVVCRSPVLTLQSGEVRQPAAVLPEPMLARFWTGAGREVLETVELAPLLARIAPLLASSDELSRAALQDTHDLYVSDEAPTASWPIQDVRMRFASLLLADSVRKLSAGFGDAELIASYGVSRSGDHDEAARERYRAMSAEEQGWFASAVKAG
jgi:hypothetical protein